MVQLVMSVMSMMFVVFTHRLNVKNFGALGRPLGMPKTTIPASASAQACNSLIHLLMWSTTNIIKNVPATQMVSGGVR